MLLAPSLIGLKAQEADGNILLSTWQQGPRAPGAQPLTPLFLAALGEIAILPKAEIKEQEQEVEELTSPPLPLAFQNPREILKDLKVRYWGRWLSRNRFRETPVASIIHPAASCVGQSVQAVGGTACSLAGL